jgi:hypothetical protein
MSRLARLVLTAVIAVVGTYAFPGISTAATSVPTAAAVFKSGITYALASCKVEDNLAATAEDYIKRCRKASILREFPSEYLDRTLAIIKTDRTTKGRKAWKLLTDSRFAKP